MAKYVASIDAGTGGSRCVIFDLKGNPVGEAYYEIPTISPRDGWAEQDPKKLIEVAYDATRAAVERSGVDPADIAALSFCAMQTSFAAIDRDENYLTNVILWQDIRGMEMFPWIDERLKEVGMTSEEMYYLTGHPVDTMQIGPKVFWLKKHHPDIYEKTWRFVTPQAMLVKGFGGDDWYDDDGAFCWWLVRDIKTGELDPRLLKAFDMDPAKYPPMAAPDALVGHVTDEVAARTGLKAGTPLYTGTGDQSCAALGAGNYGTPDIGSICLGTAGVTLVHSPEPVLTSHRVINAIGYPGGGYALEAGIAVAATALRFTRDMLYPAEAFDSDGIYDRMLEEAAKSPIGANGISFIPHLMGAVCPVNDPTVRGAFTGMSLGTTRGDLVRATVEGICYEMRDMLEAYKATGVGKFKKFRVIGGACRSDFWNQMQADVYNRPVETVDVNEATSLGAAMIAAVGAGLFENLKAACEAMVRIKHCYLPDPEAAKRYDDHYAIYLCAMRDLARETFPRLAELRRREGI